MDRGYKVSQIYGDPGLLLPLIHPPVSQLLQKTSTKFAEIALPESDIIRERQRDLPTSCPFLDDSMRKRFSSIIDG